MDSVRRIRTHLHDREWLLGRLGQVANAELPRGKASVEVKIVIQQCKMMIIERFWSELISGARLRGGNLLPYLAGGSTISLDLSRFHTLESAMTVLGEMPLRFEAFTPSSDSEIDQVLYIANLYWMDYVKTRIPEFEEEHLVDGAELRGEWDLSLLFTLYNALEDYYPTLGGKESWTGNLEQILSPMLKIYFRSIDYELSAIEPSSMGVFIEELFKCLREQGSNNLNNFPFQEEDFCEYSPGGPVRMRESALSRIQATQRSDARADIALGCPAFFSTVKSSYKHGNMVRDLYSWQMDLYSKIAAGWRESALTKPQSS